MGGVPPKVALQMCGWRQWVNEFEEAADEMEAPEDKNPFSKDEKQVIDAQKEQFRNPVVEKLKKETKEKLDDEIDQYAEEVLGKKDAA